MTDIKQQVGKLVFNAARYGESRYIFGMHDRGGEHLMEQAGKHGWVLETVGIGSDPDNHSGLAFGGLAGRGFGVIVRINNGYGNDGTIPHSSRYVEFAVRCGNFVVAAPGCHTWIIGNETNLAAERPGGEVITPDKYALCYRLCRDEIHRREGHAGDVVLTAPPAPYNNETAYTGNVRGDWVKYLADILNEIGAGNYDGVAIHTYSHGVDEEVVQADWPMLAPFDDRDFNFRAYRDFMRVIPDDVPVYLTEMNPQALPWDTRPPNEVGWPDGACRWVSAAYAEIDDWNRSNPHKQIRCAILFRWTAHDMPGWVIEPRPGVQADFVRAMQNEYVWGE